MTVEETAALAAEREPRSLGEAQTGRGATDAVVDGSRLGAAAAGEIKGDPRSSRRAQEAAYPGASSRSALAACGLMKGVHITR